MGESDMEGARDGWAAPDDQRPPVQPVRHRSPLAAITRGEQVYAQLRSDILSGRLLPGTRLRFADLTERYDCSTSVLREGLSRLAEQGLVQSEPQHGFHVTSLSQEDLEDLTGARCELEGLVLRLSIEHGGIAWESNLVAAHHALERTPMETEGDPVLMTEEWTLAHFKFHEALLAGCPNQRLLAMALSLRDAAELYRRWSRPVGHDDERDVAGEHRQLLVSALRGDAPEAVRLLEEHLRRTTRALGARQPETRATSTR
jgi:DNA-binding GntR family transcriptional regulator